MRVLRGLVGLLALSGGIVICAAPSVFGKTLDATGWYAQDRGAKFVAAFEHGAAQEGITVKFRVQPSLDQLITAVAAGSAPDVMAVHNGGSTFEALMPQKPFLPLDATFMNGLVPPELLAPYERNGKLYAVPTTIDMNNVFVNLTLLEEAGLNPPGPNWTWDDLLTMSKKLTRDTNGDGTPEIYGTAMRQYEQEIGGFIYSNGGSYMNAQVDGTEVTFDSPQTMAALEFWRSLIHDYKVAVFGWQKKLFLAGKLGFFFNGTWDIGSDQAAIGSNFNWDYIPYPKSPTTGKRANTFSGVAMAVSAATKDPKDAVRVAELGASKAIQQTFLQDHLTGAPVRSDLFNSPYMPSPGEVPKSARATIVESLSQGEAVVSTSYPDPKMLTLAQNAVLAILRNGANVQATVKKAAAQMRALLKPAVGN